MSVEKQKAALNPFKTGLILDSICSTGLPRWARATYELRATREPGTSILLFLPALPGLFTRSHATNGLCEGNEWSSIIM